MKPSIARTILISVSWIALAGCSTKHYRKSADQEVARIITQKTPSVPNMDPRFTIEQTNAFSLEGLPVVTKVEDFLGSEADRELGARVISLEKALEIGVRHSRIYQSRKEQLYLQALGLTLARHQFAPIFSGRGQTQYEVNTEEVRFVIDPLTGEPTTLTRHDAQLVEQHRIRANGSVGVNKLLRAGGRVSAALTTDFLRYLTGDPRTFTSSQVGATLLQPLWRGAGFKVAMENLTQAERSLLYALRNFTLYRKSFSVQIAVAYYGVLQNRDSARNEYLGFQISQKSAERERALAKEGRTKQAELARLEQQVLTTESRWINAIRSYQQRLDDLKIQLGLSTDASVILDDTELRQLKILDPQVSLDDAVKVALATRLDLYNVREQHDDTARGIYMAANRLKTQVDLVANAGIASKPETGTGFPVPDIQRYHWNAGLNVDLPLERKQERNAYRAALIDHEQSSRALEQSQDQIKLQIRSDLRNLESARRDYEISKIAIELSERRLEEQSLLAELGRGLAEAQVAAQTDLTRSRDALTASVVGHTIARLQFWNDMGILYIKDNGQWEEVSNAKSINN